LLELGHSHRRAVLRLYYGSALLAFGGVGFSLFHGPWVPIGMIGLGAVVGVLAAVVPRLELRQRNAPPPGPPPAPPPVPPAPVTPAETSLR
jgi:UDP-GlcNAc:undecaprenyl-phosphate GlcNAc-1-phosphate transferase